MPFLPYSSVPGGKLAQKIGRFLIFEKNQKSLKRFAKIHHFQK
jgi:hypothetical protein